ncbi:hypothetical protein [Williamsia sp. 1135]|uniref:hypothetical protein n=1 Tax=Williamsia sp. 1135 TaxID=1889262 RepID=UPI000A101752|nr:hypothetical protein [Williamsia sp. 1135]ORM37610.1 hypothetical protein BFL43_03765 [Williamsia sp. 1135]
MTDGFRPVAGVRSAEHRTPILKLFTFVFSQVVEVAAEGVEAAVEPGQLSGLDPDPQCFVVEPDRRGIAPPDEPLVIRSVVPISRSWYSEAVVPLPIKEKSLAWG